MSYVTFGQQFVTGGGPSFFLPSFSFLAGMQGLLDPGATKKSLRDGKVETGRSWLPNNFVECHLPPHLYMGE